MRYWRRSATLQIDSNRYMFDDLDFVFKVSFQDNEKLTTCECLVKNLSPETRQSIRQGSAIIINAGYEGNIGVVFAGEIASYEHTKSGTDWTTKIMAASFVDRWLMAKVNKTYVPGYASDILKDLLNIFGLEVSAFELTTNHYYSRGKVCSGKLKDVISEIVTQDCKSKFTIKNQAIYITSANSVGNLAFMLSENTGLLGAKTGQAEISTDTSVETIKRECLLNYKLGPGDRVYIIDSELNGMYRIVRGSHEGSRTGNYKTVIEVVPA